MLAGVFYNCVCQIFSGFPSVKPAVSSTPARSFPSASWGEENLRVFHPVASHLFPVWAAAFTVTTREHTQIGNGHVLACIPSWEWNQPRLMRVGSLCTPSPFHYIYHHIQSCSVRSSWEGRYTPPISPLPLYVLCGYNLQAARLGLIIYNSYLIISSSSRHIKSQLWKQKSVWHCCPLTMFHCWMEMWGHRKNNES